MFTPSVGIKGNIEQRNTNKDQPPSYNITINDTKPLWFYCSAPGSCITYQMVMGINPYVTSSTSCGLLESNGR